MLARLIFSIILFLAASHSLADEIRVAVASNFAEAATTLAQRFEASSGHKVTLSFGSTGKHYAQIKHGAPFHAFFAADMRRPQLLEQEKLTVPGSRFTYARGKLLLWSPTPGYVDAEGKVLEREDFRHLAIANQMLAPYGRAAQQVLQARGLWNTIRPRLVRGENIAQAFQYVKSGNAELGFVATVQVMRPGQPVEGSWWQVPQELYSPIEQQAVLLKDSAAARAFVDFVRSEEALAIIRSFGYDID